MSPEVLDNAVARLQHSDCFHDNMDNYESENDEQLVDNIEMTKTEALTQLLKSKGKAPREERKSPKNNVVQSKRPRLTRHGSFFDDSDSDNDSQDSLKRNIRSSMLNTKTKDELPHSKKPAKTRQLNVSSSESESESEKEHIRDVLSGNVINRKRMRGNFPSDDEISNNSQPSEKCTKLFQSDSESDNDGLVMDLDPPPSPPSNTVDLCPLSNTVVDDYGNYGNQSSSMDTLALSQSVI